MYSRSRPSGFNHARSAGKFAVGKFAADFQASAATCGDRLSLPVPVVHQTAT